MLQSPQWLPDGQGTTTGTLSLGAQAGLGEVACDIKERSLYRQEFSTFESSLKVLRAMKSI